MGFLQRGYRGMYRVSGLGSEDPKNGVVKPKYCTIDGIWALQSYYLGPWTLRACALV